MAIKQIVDKALQTPMSRKEFLKHAGLLMLVVIGVPSLLHALSESHKSLGGTTTTPATPQATTTDPDTSAYGGTRS